MYYKYGEKEIDYLKSRDRVLGNAIEKVGFIQRVVDANLFSSIIYHIIGQQISISAQATIWKRLADKLKIIDVDAILSLSTDELQSIGLTFKKTEYILSFAKKVKQSDFDLEALHNMSNEEVIKKLSSLNGIGAWTAEMILIFCMMRSDVVSYGDLAILRGMRMLYHHKKIDKNMFDKYVRRYSPYGTVASFYLWAIAAGAVPELKDLAPRNHKKKAIK